MPETKIDIAIRAKDQASDNISKIDKSFGALGDNSAASASKLNENVGLSVLKFTALYDIGLKAAGAVAGALGQGIQVAADFEAAITDIAARVELTDAELEQVSDTAKQLGINSQFSATEAADAMLQLVTSGSTAAEAIATVDDVLALAAASGNELGQTADDVTDVMAIFGLGVDESTRVVDTLVAAAGSSSATVADLTAALANGGAVASSFGFSLEDTVASLAVMAEAGIKSSEAGTALRSSLLQATRDVKKSENAWALLSERYNEVTGESEALHFFDQQTGAARDFDEVMKKVNVALQNMNDATAAGVRKDIFGSFGITGATALSNADGISAMRDAMDSQRTAAEVAETQMETWNAKVDQLGASLEGLAIEVVGPLMETYLKPLLEWVIKLVNSFVTWIDETDAVGKAIGLLKTVGDSVIPIFQNLFAFIGAIFSGDSMGILSHGANFVASLVGHFLRGLDMILKMFQRVFHSIRSFVHNIVVEIIGIVEGMVNSVLGALNNLLIMALKPFEHGALYEVIRPIVGNDGLQNWVDKGGFGLGVDFTSGLEKMNAADYEPTGLGIDIDATQQGIADSLLSAGQSMLDAANAIQDTGAGTQNNVAVTVNTNGITDDSSLLGYIQSALNDGKINVPDYARA